MNITRFISSVVIEEILGVELFVVYVFYAIEIFYYAQNTWYTRHPTRKFRNTIFIRSLLVVFASIKLVHFAGQGIFSLKFTQHNLLLVRCRPVFEFNIECLVSTLYELIVVAVFTKEYFLFTLFYYVTHFEVLSLILEVP